MLISVNLSLLGLPVHEFTGRQDAILLGPFKDEIVNSHRADYSIIDYDQENKKEELINYILRKKN